LEAEPEAIPSDLVQATETLVEKFKDREAEEIALKENVCMLI
jgi:hypothetical protein